MPSTQEIVLKLTHQNTDKIYIRFGKISKKFYDTPEYNRENYLEKFSKAMTETKTFIHSVTKNPDYTSSKSEYNLPCQKLGYYAVLDCRKVAVVQDPDLHAPLPGFVQDHIHVLPPFRPAEIRMRPAFDADRPAACAVDRAHHAAQGFLILPVLP